MNSLTEYFGISSPLVSLLPGFQPRIGQAWMAQAVSDAINSYENLVFGLGETGLSIARYFNRKKINAIYIDTRREPPNLFEIKECNPNAKFFFGDIPLDILDNIRRIIVSPGLVVDHPILNRAVELGINIVSDIDLFIESSQAEVIAITGSNGKTTTKDMIYHLRYSKSSTGLQEE